MTRLTSISKRRAESQILDSKGIAMWRETDKLITATPDQIARASSATATAKACPVMINWAGLVGERGLFG